MKTKEELNALKEEVETLHGKLKELTEEELKFVAGGEFGEDEGRFVWPRQPDKILPDDGSVPNVIFTPTDDHRYVPVK